MHAQGSIYPRWRGRDSPAVKPFNEKIRWENRDAAERGEVCIAVLTRRYTHLGYTDRRDKLYSLLGMASDVQRVLEDYEILYNVVLNSHSSLYCLESTYMLSYVTQVSFHFKPSIQVFHLTIPIFARSFSNLASYSINRWDRWRTSISGRRNTRILRRDWMVHHNIISPSRKWYTMATCISMLLDIVCRCHEARYE